MATFKEKINSLRELKTTLKSMMTESGVDLTNVPFTEYSSKLSEMQLGGGGFVEVDSLPTDNIDIDKVYKTFSYEGEFYINVSAVGSTIKASEVIMSNDNPQPYVYYYVDDIQNVKDPIDIQESSSTSGDLPVYVDKNFIGWHYSKELSDFPNEWFTLGEYFTLLLKLFGIDTTIIDGGKIDSVDHISADQICFLPDLENSKEIIGIPNVGNNKTIMHYDGSKWVELAVSTEPSA